MKTKDCCDFFRIKPGGRSTFTVDEISQFNNGWTDEENERFLSYIRQRWLVAPSHGPLNVSLNGKVDFSQVGQSSLVDKVGVF